MLTITITLDEEGKVSVTSPADMIHTLGMLDMAKHVLITTNTQTKVSTIVEARHIPGPRG